MIPCECEIVCPKRKKRKRKRLIIYRDGPSLGFFLTNTGTLIFHCSKMCVPAGQKGDFQNKKAMVCTDFLKGRGKLKKPPLVRSRVVFRQPGGHFGIHFLPVTRAVYHFLTSLGES